MSIQTEVHLLKQAVNAVALAGGNKTEAARILKVGRNTLRGRIISALRRGIEADATPSLETDETTLAERDRIGMKDRIRDLETQIKTIHRNELTAENVRTIIFGLSAKAPEPPSWMIAPPRKARVTGIPCALWSDWHWGEVVVADQVNGVNEFNLPIAHERLKHLVERTIDLCLNHMTNPKYPGIVVNLGGDMISGEIHDELTETNELPSIPLVLDLFGKLVWAITEMADKFGRVFVPCVVGNHGRTTFRPRMKNRVYSNFDWLLYSMLESHFKANGDDRVVFDIPHGTDAYYQVYGHRYLLTHGDTLGVRGGDGIIGAIGPIIRGDVKVRTSNAQMGQPYDTLLMGHWHQLLPLFPRLCVNGSLKGYDEFAKTALRASPEEPAQALWFNHPERGITCSWPVKLGPKKAAKETSWVSVPEAA